MSDEWPPPPYLPPTGGEQPLRPTGVRSWDGLTYSTIPGYRPLLLDLHVPEASARPPVVLWIHGGAWLLGDRRLPPEVWPPGALFQRIVDAGFAVATIDYRHSLEAPFPAQLHDAKAAIRYLRRFADDLGIDASRMVAWGESAGGHLAALVGLTGGRAEWAGEEGVPDGDTSVLGVVDWYGVHDGERMPQEGLAPETDRLPRGHLETLAREPFSVLVDASPLGPRAARDCSPVVQVHPDAPPFLLAHGDADSLVPYEQSELFAAALADAGVPVELRRVPGADHVFLGEDPLPLMDEALVWIAGRLG
ncbi:alpha/beta hydrolase fold domain-containing protein [Agromyces sp. SYSU T00194]|uniref:alpha/beta hydrolase fold domain-containing protein n=1 Tax=Agromyces chitinivorans TaxID=3158560 RepID=UPI0033935F7C